MARYRRVNIDGQSLYKTETRATAAALLPGTAAVINSSDQFAQATALRGRIYIIDVAYHQGLKITEAVPAGDSAVGNYVEEGRELALLCVAGAYKKDTPIKLGAAGQFTIATADTDTVIGYSQDEATIAASSTDFIRVRMRVGTVAAASGA
ncbi:head decoration [Erwinia phage Midgardsormr38]|uniref:Minor capsid protein n=1 Tax=Erwinia phage Midgardsormr38 TaxID=2663326 RepID=A0A5Q2F9W6_9CAUD|nr:head decoration [Erwinia phage Midgardsormr38]QGF21963.1 minor capsid protein [Erwinia phage Midgardsormr38]